MHLTWFAANGDTLVIADPSQAAPEPMFYYLSSDGFGGTDNEIQTRRGAYQDGFQSLSGFPLSCDMIPLNPADYEPISFNPYRVFH